MASATLTGAQHKKCGSYKSSYLCDTTLVFADESDFLLIPHVAKKFSLLHIIQPTANPPFAD
jgi:hypothetical protein